MEELPRLRASTVTGKRGHLLKRPFINEEDGALGEGNSALGGHFEAGMYKTEPWEVKNNSRNAHKTSV